MAHASPFPEAFLDALHVELLPRHKETTELMSIDDMIAFAEAVIAIAETFTIPPLKSYGEDVLRSAKEFDIVSVKHLLAAFPKMVAIINTAAADERDTAY
jgi:hypothetical protein